MGTRLFVDTAVMLYAVGGPDVLREPCRQLLVAARRRQVELHGSIELIQEFLFHRLRRVERQLAVADARDVMAACRLQSFDGPVARLVVDLVATTSIRGRDAVHAATAQLHGFAEIVTTDQGFDAVPGLQRIAPEEAVARLSGGGN